MQIFYKNIYVYTHLIVKLNFNQEMMLVSGWLLKSP